MFSVILVIVPVAESVAATANPHQYIYLLPFFPSRSTRGIGAEADAGVGPGSSGDVIEGLRTYNSETEAHFTATGLPSQCNNSDKFRYRRAAFYQGPKRARESEREREILLGTITHDGGQGVEIDCDIDSPKIGLENYTLGPACSFLCSCLHSSRRSHRRRHGRSIHKCALQRHDLPDASITCSHYSH